MVLDELTLKRALTAAAPPGPVKPGQVAGAPPLLAGLGPPLADDASLKDIARRAVRIAERGVILRALTRTGWNKRKAASRLQISYKAVLYKIKDCEIVDPRNVARFD